MARWHTDVSIRNLDAVLNKLGTLQNDFQRKSAKFLVSVAQKVARLVAKTPRKPNYPLNWDSEKQRRAFFASNGFGGGIPYQRTGQYVAAWQITATRNAQTVSALLSNASKGAQYVGGKWTRQSNIHRGRWMAIDEAVEVVMKDLPAEISRYLDAVING